MKVKQGKYARRVFVAGVGCTPFRLFRQDEEFEKLTEGEQFGWAALDAMEDAKIRPTEIGALSYGTAMPYFSSKYITPAAFVSRWAGLNMTHQYSHNEGCCTSYVGLMLAAQQVASGQFESVVCAAQDMNGSTVYDDFPNVKRKPLTPQESTKLKPWDRTYTVWNDSAMIFLDSDCSQYRLKYGLSVENIDDALLGMYENCRYNAEGNELAFKHDNLDEEGKRYGFASGNEFIRSPFNPKVSEYQHAAFINYATHGAAAAIVVSEEKAKELMEKGVECVEILGCSNAMCEGVESNLQMKALKECCDQLYDVTGLSGQDMDLLLNNDFVFPSSLTAAEYTGYIPEGEAWKYFIDGRTKYDGDRPMQTNGGRSCFGHSTGASGLADIYEAVHQIRGTAFHQMPTAPQKVLLRGYGGGQNVAAIILGKYEG